MINQHRIKLFSVVVSAALAVGACGKAQEQAEQKAAEKLAETVAQSAIKANGAQDAKVKIEDSGFKMEVTNADGSKTSMSAGNAVVTSADLGVDIYPGATPSEQGSSKLQNGQDLTLTAAFISTDTPEKVAAFYREKFKALSNGKTHVDIKTAEGAQLSMSDPDGNNTLGVTIAPHEKGTEMVLYSYKKRQ
jgi:hypothetical protein